jgi:hypothetical protein
MTSPVEPAKPTRHPRVARSCKFSRPDADPRPRHRRRKERRVTGTDLEARADRIRAIAECVGGEALGRDGDMVRVEIPADLSHGPGAALGRRRLRADRSRAAIPGRVAIARLLHLRRRAKSARRCRSAPTRSPPATAAMVNEPVPPASATVPSVTPAQVAIGERRGETATPLNRMACVSRRTRFLRHHRHAEPAGAAVLLSEPAAARAQAFSQHGLALGTCHRTGIL